ncbi:MAG: hypothetical protein U1E59_15635 [Amaricoccus sp.]
MSDRAETEVPQADLHAYVDGQLGPTRRKAIEGWLGEHPMIAATVDGWRAQNAAIRELFESDADAAQAADDWRRVRALRARLARPRPRWVVGVATVSVLGLGAVAGAAAAIGWFETLEAARAAPSLTLASRELWQVYASDVVHPVEIAGDREGELLGWLGKRLGSTLSAPDLSRLGLRLLGGRLVPYAGASGALLVYEDGAGRRLGALIVRDASGASEPDRRLADRDGIATVSWRDDELRYALSAPVPRARLLEVATAFRAQL